MSIQRVMQDPIPILILFGLILVTVWIWRWFRGGSGNLLRRRHASSSVWDRTTRRLNLALRMLKFFGICVQSYVSERTDQ